MIRLLFAVVLAFASLAATAAVEVHSFNTPEQAERYKQLTEELRCLVCQNQNLADSNAALARDLRSQVYTMVQRGDSDGRIVDYMVARYGDFVLYRPRLRANTLLLWGGPFVLLGVGLSAMLLTIRKRTRAAASPPVDADGQARARAALRDDKDDDMEDDSS
jgi:cytochrome c-type biogenesis protein CcmH